MQAQSCTFTLFPHLMASTSERNTALYQMLQSSPRIQSPVSTAFSAIKQFFPHRGVFPSTVFMIAILNMYMFYNSGAKVIKILKSYAAFYRKRVAILEKMDCNPLYLIIYKSYDNSIIYSFGGTYYS